MKDIVVLDQSTIDKIAAGEVIERPASIVKELVENAIDAGAGAITAEIRDGGISLIRITDNGEGIEKGQLPTAFLRHATSKIKKAEDLLTVSSLGFRGEALSSIAAVCQVEVITKTAGTLFGTRYRIEGGEELLCEDIGAPEGTTFIVNNVFFNTPARKKFLKSPMTEAGYISELMERMALSHPEISFKFINNRQTRLHTSGNTNLKDIIYGIYGRDIAANLASVSCKSTWGSIEGYIGKPVISRGNRNFENYFVNGRYVKSKLITKAIEDAYQSFMMQHKYPFTVLHITIDSELLDINVHPTKMELRFSNQEELYQALYKSIREALSRNELIPEVTIREDKKVTSKPPEPKQKENIPEPFEQFGAKVVREDNPYGTGTAPKPLHRPLPGIWQRELEKDGISQKEQNAHSPVLDVKAEQMNLFENKLLSTENVKQHRIIGQVFDTYWIVQFQDKMYLIDQHAAHEKVLYEQTMKRLKNKQILSQRISPPVILTLGMKEEEVLKRCKEMFRTLGFEIEHFGGREYALSAVPDNLFGIAQETLFLEILDGLMEQNGKETPDSILEKVASMSCKAAVKGNHRMSVPEAMALIDKLMTLDNPYNCPHGRPTIISMSKRELEKKFKRIV